jgi:hypothetical protein
MKTRNNIFKLIILIFLGVILFSTIYNQVERKKEILSNYGIMLPADDVIFTVTGSFFTPTIVVGQGAKILWTFPDGTTSNSPNPNRMFGSSGIRKIRLKVTPWNAITRLNLGFDGKDTEIDNFEHVTAQSVSAIQHFNLMRESLREFCYSYNQFLSSLDFSNFTKLETIESYGATGLISVNLTGTSSLKRVCFEKAKKLSVIDLSDSPNMHDLRGSTDHSYTLIFSTDLGGRAHYSHICVHDLEMTTNLPPMNTFPQLKDMLIWNLNQAGELNCSGMQHIGYCPLQKNHYTSAVFSNSTANNIDLSDNALKSITLIGCNNLVTLNLHNNYLDPVAVNGVLHDLDILNRKNGIVDLSGNSEPYADGMEHINSLIAKGWTVTVDGSLANSSRTCVGGGGCLIVYDSRDSANLKTLRKFRDMYLLKNEPGKKFVKFVYKNSAVITKFIKQHPWVRNIVRGVLTPIVWMIKVSTKIT